MVAVNIKMLIRCLVPTFSAIVFLLGPSCLAQMPSNNRHRRINARRIYKQYKGVLKAANMTSFPEGDIRTLIIGSHEFSKGKDRKLVHPHSAVPIPTKFVNTHIASSTNVAATTTISRKKGGRKGRKQQRPRPDKMSSSSSSKKPIVVSPGSLWEKKLFAMRREETEQLLRRESNELESRPTKGQSTSTDQNSRRGSLRKDRSRKKDRRKQHHHQRKPITSRPIMGKPASLNIAKLKQRCKTKPMKQEIRVEGCLSKSIMNNLCYGQCNSFYIPEIRGRGNGPPSFTSCAFCRPRTVRPILVTLRCTGKRGRTRLKRKKVNYVKKCRCMDQQFDVGRL